MEVGFALNGFPECGGTITQHIQVAVVNLVQNDGSVFCPVCAQQGIETEALHAQSVWNAVRDIFTVTGEHAFNFCSVKAIGGTTQKTQSVG
jgi:hypothetical protein